MKPNESSLDYDAFCDRLQAINFQPVIQTLQQRLGWTKQQINQGIECYKQLLFLIKKYPEKPLVPDKMTDEVVHAHLETGEQFVQDCLQILGFELEHEAGFGSRGQSDRRNWLAVFSQTQALLSKHFGVVRSKSSGAQIEALTFDTPTFCVLRMNDPAYCVLHASTKHQSTALLF